MKDELPSPEFDANQYMRPTQNWICGRACEGQPCRIGPDANGRCRAISECTPALELKEGETKGRYRCTRPSEYGGPCENGPLPDGSCSRAIPRCQPVRSLRAKRRVFTYSVITATMGFILLALGGEQRWKFINPGGLSAQHSSSGFAEAYTRLHIGQLTHGDQGCAACHSTAHAGPVGWVKSAIAADPGPLRSPTPALMATANMTSIDEACQRCHVGHTFHEPNVVREHYCSTCHQEHLGSGPMSKPDVANCVTCHGDAAVMEASFEKGKRLSPAVFDFRPHNGRQVFTLPRPERGYTKVIHAFAADHPEFRVVAEKLKDPDTLKFNHELHLASPTIPKVGGRALECADCHKPDAAGIYYQKISFEENCRRCHSLQFDAHNPDLNLPHGNPEFVRAFLRSLPTQYAGYGAHERGLTNKVELDQFVKQQMLRIREQTLSGEDLEQEVFFSVAKLESIRNVSGSGGQGRTRFPGCAYCHEVKTAADGEPALTKPVIFDRWLARGGFNHAKHLQTACVKCHEVSHSTQSADILLPSKATCVECHSPKGGVANGCSTCHDYHTPINSLTLKNEFHHEGN